MDTTTTTLIADAVGTAMQAGEAAVGAAAGGGGIAAIGVAAGTALEQAAVTDLPGIVSALQAQVAGFESRIAAMEAKHPLIGLMAGILGKFFPQEMPLSSTKG